MENTILVVDNESMQRNEIRRVLSSAGFDILEAADYSTAKALHNRRRDAIDLLLVDVSLPGGNGFELAEELKANASKLKIIYMSGPAGFVILRYLGITANDARYLRKPFRPTELVMRVHRALERPEPARLPAGSASRLPASTMP